jgi:glycosyltransferase involved in cell wall biosynthesis
MRILMLTASLPYPPASGGALRCYGLIHGLHASGHEVVLLSFHDGNVAPQSTPLGEWCARIETVPPPQRTKADRLRHLLLSRQPDIAHRMFSEIFAQKLRMLLQESQFDLIQFEGIEVVCYLPTASTAQPSAKLCFDTFNAEYALQRAIFEVDRKEIKRWPAALYSWIQSGRIYRYEREMCQKADLVIAVSPEDAALLQDFRNDERVCVVPNGIFTEQYRGDEKADTFGENALVFTGKMDYRPNVDAMLWFVDEILPKIIVNKHIPDAHLYIIGQQPDARIWALAHQPNITVQGWVESVQPYLRAADVYVAPLRMGSGTRLKLLEAMASGCAIVATSVAASGLEVEAKQAIATADTAEAFAEAITNLLKDPVKRREMGENAQKIIAQHYDWSVLMPRLLAAYREIGLG